jgi:hypothetical protein
MDRQNIAIFQKLFRWHNIEDVTKSTIHQMIKIINKSFNNSIEIDCSWGFYKNCKIYSKKQPLYFFKYVREYYFSEVLGLHLTHYFFDPELCAPTCLTGLYIKEGLLRTTEIPYLFTSFIRGKNISNYDITKFKFELGRQCFLHEVLSLYDVYDRHFILKNDNIIARIDFGRSFENMHKKYLGFNDYLEEKDLDFFDEELQMGYKKEKQIIRKNLEGKKSELAQFVRRVKMLHMDSELIFFPIERFVNRLIDHWSRIGFLNDMNMTKIKWI